MTADDLLHSLLRIGFAHLTVGLDGRGIDSLVNYWRHFRWQCHLLDKFAGFHKFLRSEGLLVEHRVR